MKKKKLEKLQPVTQRTADNVPFFIPKVYLEGERPEDKQNKFVSPIYGSNVKDEIVVPRTAEKKVDVDRLYEPFRGYKKLTKEEEIKRYGEPYAEFPKINSSQVKTNTVKEEIKEVKSEDIEEIIQENYKETYENSKDDFEFLDMPTYNEPIDDSFYYEEDEKDDSDDVSYLFGNDQKIYVEDFFREIEEDEEETNEPSLFEKLTSKQYNSEVKEEKVVKEEVKKFETEQTIKEEVKDDDSFGFTNYKLPPISLLNRTVEKKNADDSWIQENIDKINKTLEDFRVDAVVSNYTKGPTIIRYEISPRGGVPVKKIANMRENFQLNLAAESLRIEAPIPGKAAVGIEVPNKVREMVYFGDLANEKFIQDKDPLNIAVGLDIEGNPIYSSIDKMPHGLVAGSTRSGKSVFIGSVIMSILLRTHPADVKLMLIDPKKVDLQQFAGIPHLITPIIDDTKTAIAGLKWAVDEMERRYDVLKSFNTVNVHDYYERASKKPNFEPMPRIVIIIEEACDLFMSGGQEVEDNILRLTQKARAAGMHVIIATQRPTAKIINGNIKSNIPARFAFKVPSTIDSMTVLDQPGAEELIGNGDCFYSLNGSVCRVQAAFISPQEIEMITSYCKNQARPRYMFTHDSIVSKSSGSKDDIVDELFADVCYFVVREGKCSTNQITRKFAIGFNRATQIVETMERYGIVAENTGPKAREVLVNLDDLPELFEDIPGVR